MLSGGSKTGTCEAAKILIQQVDAVIQQVKNELVALVNQFGRKADHHLGLAALGLAVDDEGMLLLPKILDSPVDCVLDTARMFACALEPLKLTLVLHRCAALTREALDIELHNQFASPSSSLCADS